MLDEAEVANVEEQPLRREKVEGLHRVALTGDEAVVQSPEFGQPLEALREETDVDPVGSPGEPEGDEPVPDVAAGADALRQRPGGAADGPYRVPPSSQGVGFAQAMLGSHPGVPEVPHRGEVHRRRPPRRADDVPSQTFAPVRGVVRQRGAESLGQWCEQILHLAGEGDLNNVRFRVPYVCGELVGRHRGGQPVDRHPAARPGLVEGVHGPEPEFLVQLGVLVEAELQGLLWAFEVEGVHQNRMELPRGGGLAAGGERSFVAVPDQLASRHEGFDGLLDRAAVELQGQGDVALGGQPHPWRVGLDELHQLVPQLLVAGTWVVKVDVEELLYIYFRVRHV